jgi:hypothetical protein
MEKYIIVQTVELIFFYIFVKQFARIQSNPQKSKKIGFHFQTKQLWTIELSKRENKIGTENEERLEER